MRTARKSLIGAIGAVSLVVALAGCSGTDDDGGSAGDDVVTGPGVSDSTIKIGQITDLTGPFGPVGKAYLEGTNLYIAATNAAGGVCGRELELVVEDHGYDVQRATTSYRKISEDVAILSGVLGGGMANALLPLITEDQLIMSPLTWTGSLINGTNVFLPGPDYGVQVGNGTSWALDEFGIEKGDTIGFIGFTGEVGESVLAGAKSAADPLGVTVVENFMAPTDTDFTAQIANLKSAGAKLVVVISSSVQLGTIVSTAEAASFDTEFLAGAPGIFDESILDGPAKDAFEDHVYIASGQAPWADPSDAAKAVRDLYEKAGSSVAPQFGILTGYAQAEATGQILEAACEKGDLSREGLLSAFKGLSQVDTGGLITTLDFTGGAGVSQSNETMILRPDSSVDGGLSLYVPIFTSDAVGS